MSSQYRQSGYERKERDFYPTPAEYIEWLFQHWRPSPDRAIHEPCCGDLAMVGALYANGAINVTFSDIAMGVDYLEDYTERDVIITNPPYGKLAPLIVRRAIEYSFACAFLLPFDRDAAGSRANLFTRESTFSMKITCNKRVKWIADSASSGMHNYAWFVWAREQRGQEPLLRYAPN
jgi:hypothetical protein